MNLINNSKIYIAGLGILILILLSGSLVFRDFTSKKVASATTSSVNPTSTPTLASTSTPTPSITPTSTPTPTPEPTQTPAPPASPSQVINLSNWKLTLPTGSS